MDSGAGGGGGVRDLEGEEEGGRQELGAGDVCFCWERQSFQYDVTICQSQPIQCALKHTQ